MLLISTPYFFHGNIRFHFSPAILEIPYTVVDLKPHLTHRFLRIPFLKTAIELYQNTFLSNLLLPIPEKHSVSNELGLLKEAK